MPAAVCLFLVQPMVFFATYPPSVFSSAGGLFSMTGSSYYMSCDNMRIDHYQELMDRGWRRSGSLYYKPDLPRSCCPHYTIRYANFVPETMWMDFS